MALAGALAIGCGDDSHDGGDPLDGGFDDDELCATDDAAVAASPGESSGTLYVQYYVDVDTGNGCWGMADVDFSVSVADSLGDVTDATVLAGPVGHTVEVPHWQAGLYSGDATGWAPAWELTVTRGDDHLSDFVLPSPSPNDLVLDPAEPTAGRPLELRWTTGGQGIEALVWIERISDDEDTFNERVPDSGSLLLPESAFPTPGVYLVQLFRTAVAWPGGVASSNANVSSNTLLQVNVR